MKQNSVASSTRHMKTAFDWFKTLEQPYQSMAIANSSETRLKELHPSLKEAIALCFLWEKSPQGWQFWLDFHNGKKTRTAAEWFKELPELEEMLALKNTKEPDLEYISLREALVGSFFWKDTPEGYDFWRSMADGGEPEVRDVTIRADRVIFTSFNFMKADAVKMAEQILKFYKQHA